MEKINNVPLPVYFRTVLYTGNGGTQSITGVGFEPDVVWIKDRIDGTYKHQIYDSTRGATKKYFQIQLMLNQQIQQDYNL